ncbi:MAG: hypothetical protein IT564_11765, partial [Rhodospirillales bacterium]|nr:hypothetical protein [Rhodospirillales bacterium]
WSKGVNKESGDGAAATVRCLVDERFLYLGVAVMANSLRFETAPFGQGWRNDSVEVFLSSAAPDSPAHLRMGMIRISSDSSGRTVTEGSLSVADGVHTTRRFSYPLLSDAVGVKTGLQVAPAGYAVEIAIPRYSIGWTDARVSPAVTMNVRVRRSCGKKPCQAVLESSEDPYNTSPASDERYRRVSFGGLLPERGTLVRGPGAEVLAPLVLGAILRLDAYDPEGAVERLRESQDRRVLPVLGSTLVAAGQLDFAVSVLDTFSRDESGDALRLWATEQMAYSHLLQEQWAQAEGGYATLAASSHPALQDIGVAGLIDVALADGRGDSAMEIYQSAFGSVAAPCMRSGCRIATWLQKQGRLGEAIEILTRLSQNEWADDSERAWTLLQLQSLYQRKGDIDKAVAIGWRLQQLAPPGDPSGEASLKQLIRIAAFGRVTLPGAVPFSETYRRFLEANPGASDPARKNAYAAELDWEGKSDAAAALYEEISRDAIASRKDRAAALLSLQRLRLKSGQVERSVEAGLAMQDVYPEDLGSRLASWQLISAARAAGETPFSRRKEVEDFGRALVRDIGRLAQDSTGMAQRRAQALLLQFAKEISQQ